MDFYEEDYDDEPRRRRRKSRILKRFKRSIRRRGDDDDEYDDSSDDDGGFLRRKKGANNKKKRGKKSKKKEREEDDVAMPLPGQSSSSANNKGSSFRKIKNALVKGNRSSFPQKENQKNISGATPPSSNATGTTRRRQRRRQSNASEDRSVDSPPSVASTDNNSVDGMGSRAAGTYNQHAHLQFQARQQQRKNKNNNGFNRLLFANKDPDGITGAAMEAMSLDYYYQSIPWIIKTWIYFLTVVVPFTFLYYCFVGIFHSSSLASNPFLQHVAIANIFFTGLGCTFRSGFWARQALDTKGILAKLPGSENKSLTFQRRVLRGQRTRDGTKPTHSTSPTNANRTMTSFPKSAIRLPRPRSNSIRGRNSAARSLEGSSTFVPPMRTSQLRRPSAPSIRQSGIHKTNSASRMVENSGHSTGLPRVWDVETMIPTRKKQSANAPGRPKMDKNKSILEIYELHAKDEKVALLQV